MPETFFLLVHLKTVYALFRPTSVIGCTYLQRRVAKFLFAKLAVCCDSGCSGCLFSTREYNNYSSLCAQFELVV